MKMGLSARHGRLPRPDAVDDLIAFGVQRKAAVEWIGKRSDTVDETAPRWRDLEPDMRIRIANLYRLAGKVFVDRNAKGLEAPGTPSLRESGARRATAKDRREQDRLKIKAEMRPHLRKAIAHGRKSRDALLAGD